MNLEELSAVQGRAWDDVDVSDAVIVFAEQTSRSD